MPFKCQTLRELLVSTVAIGILFALFVPCRGCGKIINARKTACACNLRQLYQLGTVYASAHKGEWPQEKGSSLWLSFAKSSPPLLATDHLEMLGCPVRGEWEPGQCDYLGPRKLVSELKPGDALGACKPGNHGEATSGNVLLKDGTVLEYEYTHPIWETLAP